MPAISRAAAAGGGEPSSSAAVVGWASCMWCLRWTSSGPLPTRIHRLFMRLRRCCGTLFEHTYTHRTPVAFQTPVLLLLELPMRSTRRHLLLLLVLGLGIHALAADDVKTKEDETVSPSAPSYLFRGMGPRLSHGIRTVVSALGLPLSSGFSAACSVWHPSRQIRQPTISSGANNANVSGPVFKNGAPAA